MTVQVRLFAAARAAVDRETIEIAVEGRLTVAEAKRQLLAQYPALAAVLPHCRFAVNEAYVSDASEIERGDRVACIPPVSGG